MNGVVACLHLHDSDGRHIGWLTPGPTHEYRRESIGVKWCFKCRKHLPHDFVVIGDPPDVESYYDPTPSYRCSGCNQDHTLFPGWERTWGDG
jgi:hypothetical protein